jgi:hypothetical protein
VIDTKSGGATRIAGVGHRGLRSGGSCFHAHFFTCTPDARQIADIPALWVPQVVFPTMTQHISFGHPRSFSQKTALELGWNALRRTA